MTRRTGSARRGVVWATGLLLLASAAWGRDFYAAANGSAAADGSLAHPWDLPTALEGRAVHPGDTVWLRGGHYGDGQTIFYSRLVGTKASPIVVRQYPGERAILDGWLQVGCCDNDPQPAKGAYVWFWGLEFASSVTDRTGAADGPPNYAASAVKDAIDSWAPGSRFIHNVIHDARMGIALWEEAVDAEAYGNLIYFNGFQGPDRGHGHGFYVQNNTGTMTIADNVIFGQFNHGMQFYGSAKALVRNLNVEGNIVFDNGVISRGPDYGDNVIFANSNGVAGVRMVGNHLYFTPSKNAGYNVLGWTGNKDAVVRDNFFIGGFQAISLGEWEQMDFENNTVYSKDKYLVLTGLGGPGRLNWNRNRYFGSGLFQGGLSGTDFAGWQERTGLDRNSTFQAGEPKGVWSFVEPSKYELGRANVVIYNWDRKPEVAVDLSGVLKPGAGYEIRDAQNFLAPPVRSGVYRGGSIALPMTGLTLAKPNGSVPSQPSHTGPEFGVFIVTPSPVKAGPATPVAVAPASAKPAARASQGAAKNKK